MKVISKEKILKISFLLLIVGFIIYGYVEREHISANRQFTTGEIVKISYAAGNGIDQYIFTYTVGERAYENSTPKKGNVKCIIGRHFPVIYNQQNHAESEILITESDFARFNVTYPDSLK